MIGDIITDAFNPSIDNEFTSKYIKLLKSIHTSINLNSVTWTYMVMVGFNFNAVMVRKNETLSSLMVSGSNRLASIKYPRAEKILARHKSSYDDGSPRI